VAFSSAPEQNVQKNCEWLQVASRSLLWHDEVTAEKRQQTSKERKQ
jgi:hypothetical protein